MQTKGVVPLATETMWRFSELSSSLLLFAFDLVPCIASRTQKVEIRAWNCLWGFSLLLRGGPAFQGWCFVITVESLSDGGWSVSRPGRIPSCLRKVCATVGLRALHCLLWSQCCCVTVMEYAGWHADVKIMRLGCKCNMSTSHYLALENQFPFS